MWWGIYSPLNAASREIFPYVACVTYKRKIFEALGENSDVIGLRTCYIAVRSKKAYFEVRGAALATGLVVSQRARFKAQRTRYGRRRFELLGQWVCWPRGQCGVPKRPYPALDAAISATCMIAWRPSSGALENRSKSTTTCFESGGRSSRS